jgi:YidC/Oxa1 family membrane protein insertase
MILAYALLLAQNGAAVAEHPDSRLWTNEIFAGALAGFYDIIPSFGLAIILLTLAVRVILLPLSIKQTRSMREMQRIQPEIKRLQQKYKGNRQKMNEELMALYKEHSVNPFGGCLPLLMQFPVLIALFYVIRAPLKYLGYSVPEGTPANAVVEAKNFVAQNASGLMDTLQDSSLVHALRETGAAVYRFVGLRLDCSASNVWSQGHAAGGACPEGFVQFAPYIVLVLLMGLTTWYQQRQMTASRGAPADAQTQQMQMFAKIMPLMLMVFSFSFPSGVVLYWLTTNLWTIGQQRLVLRAVPPLEAPAKKKPEASDKAPPQKKPPPGEAAKAKGSDGTSGDGTPSPKQRARGGTANRKKKRR